MRCGKHHILNVISDMEKTDLLHIRFNMNEFTLSFFKSYPVCFHEVCGDHCSTPTLPCMTVTNDSLLITCINANPSICVPIITISIHKKTPYQWTSTENEACFPASTNSTHSSNLLRRSVDESSRALTYLVMNWVGKATCSESTVRTWVIPTLDNFVKSLTSEAAPM